MMTVPLMISLLQHPIRNSPRRMQLIHFFHRCLSSCLSANMYRGGRAQSNLAKPCNGNYCQLFFFVFFFFQLFVTIVDYMMLDSETGAVEHLQSGHPD